MRRASSFVMLAILVAGVAMARTAAGNGRIPMVNQVVFRAGAPDDMILRATWGLLVSRDGGASVRWICEDAVGYGGAYDPTYVWRANGALFATSFEGVKVNRDGCRFEPTGLGIRFATALAEGLDGTLYAAVADNGDTKIYRSTDDGATFPASSNPDPQATWWESMWVGEAGAPAKKRIYLTGYRIIQGTKTTTFFRNVDGGEDFEAVAVPQEITNTNSLLQIAAVSPSDGNLIFVRVTYAQDDVVGDRFYRSPDAGTTWTPVLYVPDTVPGFVVRRDGDVIAASQRSGTWRSTDGGLTFGQQATSLAAECLVERPDGVLFGCGANGEPDRMAVGRSTDGLAWTKVFQFGDAVGPVDCAKGTLQCDRCQAMLWCGLRLQLGITADPTTCDIEGGDETSCGAVAPPDAGATSPPARDGGCCGAASGPAGSALLALVVALGLSRYGGRRGRRGRGS